MPRPLQLEDFAQAPVAASGPLLAEEARLAAYEEGYKAGWDDAAAADAQANTRVSADLARNLADISFTFAEAQSHVLNGVGPLLTLMAEKMLPEMARDGFAQTVIEQVQKIAAEHADAPLELVVNPQNRAAVETVLTQANAPVSLTISEEPSLGPGQAYLRGAHGETALDIDAVQETIRAAIDAFLSPEQEVQAHG